MKTSIIALICLWTFNACQSSQKESLQPNEEQKAIEELVDKYIQSINTCDTTLVNDIWSHDSTVSFVAPSGYYKTYNEIRDSFVVGIFDKFFITRKLQKEDLKININQNTAWIEFSWIFDALRNDSTQHSGKGFETQIAEKGSDKRWRLVHVHYSQRK